VDGVLSQLGGSGPRPAGEIRSLNSIRGVAALMVALFHAPLLLGVSGILPHAYLAVDLFFVLSGFVMLHAYDARIGAGLGLGRFVQLRLARLYPLLLLATLAGFAILYAKHVTGHGGFNRQTLAALPRNLALAPAAAGASDLHAAYPFVTQSWSIVWEIVLCPLLFVWARWIRRGAWLIAAIFAVVLAIVAASQGTLDGGWTTPTFWIGGLRALVAFWAGVAVRQWTRRGALPRVVGLAGLGAAAAVLTYVALVHRTFWQADVAAAVLGFPLIITAASGCRSRLLENALGDRLGEASYAIYMLHNLTIDTLVTVLKHVPHLGTLAHMALSVGWLLGLIVGAWLCWRWVETPLRVFFSRADLSGRRPGVAAIDRLARLSAVRGG
jgi:peptidoglycan/LPS O-acetylase OafA/YrhL